MKTLLWLGLIIGVSFLFYLDRSFVPDNIEELQKQANESTDLTVPKAFTTDGCTLSPNSFFGIELVDICIEHDMKYWAGGSKDERLSADLDLRDGVNSRVMLLGEIYYWGTRIGGHPIIPMPWRWGYGFDYW